MPKWAKNEHDFIRIQRECLEHPLVKKNLKPWLDMIFGTRQEDKTKKNIFFCYAYEVNIFFCVKISLLEISEYLRKARKNRHWCNKN